MKRWGSPEKKQRRASEIAASTVHQRWIQSSKPWERSCFTSNLFICYFIFYFILFLIYNYFLFFFFFGVKFCKNLLLMGCSFEIAVKSTWPYVYLSQCKSRAISITERVHICFFFLMFFFFSDKWPPSSYFIINISYLFRTKREYLSPSITIKKRISPSTFFFCFLIFYPWFFKVFFWYELFNCASVFAKLLKCDQTMPLSWLSNQ